MLALCCCAGPLAACAGGGANAVAYPAGWAAGHPGRGPVVYTDPKNPHQSYKATNVPANGTTMTDRASAVTTDTLLHYTGSKLLNAKPFPGCPGEAGLQVFDVPAGRHGHDLLQVGFSVWEGRQKTAYYERPANAPDSPQAMAAMRRTLCSAG